MKKPVVIVLVLIVLAALVWYFGSNKGGTSYEPAAGTNATSSASAPVSETTKVSDKLSEYKNDELGFSVKYPSAWEVSPAAATINYFIPLTKATSNTVKKLESKIAVTSGKCSFPPVTTVKERTTLKSGDLSFNMISMTNSVQGNNYFDRMYSVQKESVCYTLSFSSITTSPASAGIKGSEATQVTNNNKAIVDAADAAFTAMVKSFAYVSTPVGQDETVVAPAKK